MGFNADDRRRMAGKAAMQDGAFPIPDKNHLQKAIRAVGRARPNTPEHRAKVRRHIIQRARALGATDMIPEDWNSNGSLKNGNG